MYTLHVVVVPDGALIYLAVNKDNFTRTERHYTVLPQ